MPGLSIYGMTLDVRTAIDTNVISALWSGEPSANTMIDLLGSARNEGSVVICGVVYAELLAYPKATAKFVDDFLRATEIQIDFDIGEAAWRDAAQRFGKYAERRRRSKGVLAKRLIADFIVGAHAVHKADRLITLDASRYKIDFAQLKLLP
jgi:predicted nucleic acid-binding protein